MEKLFGMEELPRLGMDCRKSQGARAAFSLVNTVGLCSRCRDAKTEVHSQQRSARGWVSSFHACDQGILLEVFGMGLWLHPCAALAPPPPRVLCAHPERSGCPVGAGGQTDMGARTGASSPEKEQRQGYSLVPEPRTVSKARVVPRFTSHQCRHVG